MATRLLTAFFALALVSAPATADAQAEFIRGDCNGDGYVNIADAIALNLYLFQGGAVPGCIQACDINDDDKADVADVATVIEYLVAGFGNPIPSRFN